MSIPEDVRSFNELVVTSFDNAMDTVESVHHNAIALYLGLLTEVGLPRERADALTDRHRALLRRVYGAVCTVNHDLGDMVVAQVENVSRFAESIGVPLPDSPAAEVDELARVLRLRRDSR
jgi:hypothetical protein